VVCANEDRDLFALPRRVKNAHHLKLMALAWWLGGLGRHPAGKPEMVQTPARWSTFRQDWGPKTPINPETRKGGRSIHSIRGGFRVVDGAVYRAFGGPPMAPYCCNAT
jgi:hypothetical protein